MAPGPCFHPLLLGVVSKMGWETPGAGAGKTNELVVSLNVFISHPADKQSPGARQPPTSHPYRQLRTLNKEGHFKGGTLQRGGDTSCNTRGDEGHFQWSFTPGWENPYSFQKCSTAEKTHFLCDISNIAWISFIMHPDKKECIDILCDISYMRAYKGGERHNAEEPQARPEIVK